MNRSRAIHSHATTIGYCTNVHAGTDLESIRENLIRYSLPVRDLVGGQSLGVGLWIPNDASVELIDGGAAEFAEFLRSRRLAAFTINGFPFANFHQDVVKHDVYSPAWWDDARLEYTRRLAAILAVVLDESQSVGSISTLPIGWGKSPGDEKIHRAGANLRAMADSLEKLESTSGRRIVLAIEPEPGCYLDTVGDCLAFFEKELPDESHRRYITVCHDVCHSAVMMEDQRDVLSRLATAGIGVGKVQVSSAILADWDSMAIGRRHEAIDQLRDFAEDRYLHQIGRKKSDGSFELVEDLPGLLDSLPTDGDPVAGDQRWVIHFHVPIFLERFRHLSTTHDEVGVALRTLDSLQGSLDFTGHLEIETYAWTVLPESMRRRGLSDDIASEIEWLKRQQDQ